MSLQGKGYFIWKIRDCEKGDVEAIAEAARLAGYSHVLIKVADGNYPYNVDPKTKQDLVPALVAALRARAIGVWGWQYIYGFDPLGEAKIAVKRAQEFNLDGFVIDAEGEFKLPGRANAAKRYAQELRKQLPSTPLALSSYRFPTYHRDFPWKPFLDVCDLNMPQVYWEKSHNAGKQLERCVNEFKTLSPGLPVMPTGPGYKAHGWKPTVEDYDDFLQTAVRLNLSAVNFFSWDECRRDLPQLWDHFAAFAWNDPVQAPPPGIAGQLIQALNRRQIDTILSLYFPDAIHVTSERTVQGQDAIRAYYQKLITETMPGASFVLGNISGSDALRQFSWKATSPNLQVEDGTDALGILDGKIACHYTTYKTVEKSG